MAVCWRWPVTEKGHDIAKLRAFLQTREEQPLPETVASFVKTVQWQGRALKRIGTAVLIHCEDAEVVALIAMHKETTGLCLRAGDHNLVVRLEREKNSGSSHSFIYWALVWLCECQSASILHPQDRGSSLNEYVSVRRHPARTGLAKAVNAARNLALQGPVLNRC
jgi:hypothetical protein